MTAPKGYDIAQIPQMTPEQMQLFQQLLGSLGGGPQAGLGYLSKLAAGDEDIFAQIEAPAYQALQQGLAQTANRFSGVGAQDSSAFQNTLAGQSASLAQNLASQRSQLQQSAIDKLLGYSNQLLGQKPYETVLQEQQGIDWGQLIGQIPALALQAFGIYNNPLSKLLNSAKDLATPQYGSINRSGNPPIL